MNLNGKNLLIFNTLKEGNDEVQSFDYPFKSCKHKQKLELIIKQLKRFIK